LVGGLAASRVRQGYNGWVEEKRLGPYVILETIGRGAAGRVFRARSPEGREVALKLLIGSLSPESLGRFERERNLLSQLGHDLGFVPLLDAGTTPHGPYVVMELMHGGSLRDRLQRTGKLDLASAIELGADLAAALSAAHTRGVVHRDLKPGNILFTREGGLRVADLGLAKAYDDVASDSLSKTGVLRGTIGYMPPEQMLDAKRAGPPSDVFAWGAVLYEVLTGEPAFGNGPPMEVVYNLERGNYVPLRELRPDVPMPLAALISRCLATEVSERPRDGAALVAEFAQAALPLQARSRTALGVGLALGALLLLVTGVALGVSLATPPPAAATPTPSATPLEPPPSSPSPRQSPTPAPSPVPSPTPEPSQTPAAAPAGFQTPTRPLPRHLGALKGERRLKLRAVFGDYKGRHLGLVTDVAWGPGGTHLVTVELAGWVRIWDAKTGEVVVAFQAPQRLHTVDTSPGPWGVIGGDTGGVLLRLDGTTGVKELPKRGKCVSARFVSSNRVAVSEGTSLTVYEVPSGRQIWRVEAAHPDEGTYINGLRYVASRNEIVTGQRSIRIWSAVDGELLRKVSLPEDFVVEDLAVTAGGDRIFVSGQAPKLIQIERTTEELGVLDLTQPGYTRALETLPNGALFTGHDDGSIQFRSSRSPGERVGQHGGWVHGLRFGPNAALASVGNDSQLRVWRLQDPQRGPESARPAWAPSGHVAPVEQLEVLGGRVYSRGRDGLRVWNRRDASQITALPPEPLMGRRAAVVIALSPSGKRLIRLGHGFAVDDLETGRLLQWSNKSGRPEFLNPSFVDENTLSLINLKGEEQRIDLETKKAQRVPHPGTILALRYVHGLGWLRVFEDRLEAEVDGEIVRSSLPRRPSWSLVDSRGSMVLITPNHVIGTTFDRSTGSFRSVQAPLGGQLTCAPAFSQGLRWLAIATQETLTIYDTSSGRALVADRIELAPHGETVGAMTWSREGELWIASRLGPLLCYEVH
jgi:serine/threonine protein kinase/WD40 repeat protein